MSNKEDSSNDITIITDTREQEPWTFSFFNFSVAREKLDTGDYSLAGTDKLITIERKRTVGEIAINLGSKWKQFSAELDRMCEFQYRYIICEFPEHYIDTFPKNSGIPKKRWKFLKMRGRFIKSRLYIECDKREIKVFFRPTKEEAEQKAVDLLLNAYFSDNNQQ